MVKDSNYRLNVGIIIVNDNGKLLLCKRSNSNNWQFPQGGIDFGEKPLNAAIRETFEEVGIKSNCIEMIAETNNWYKYDVPINKRKKNFLQKKFLGQKQKWFLFKLIKNCEVSFANDPANEFEEHKWVSYWHPITKIVSFKKDVYRNALLEFKETYSNMFSNKN